MARNYIISIKIRLFLPVAIIILLVILFATIFSARTSIETVQSQIEHNLVQQVTTISKMFEREKTLKTEKVNRSLKILHDYFFSQKLSFSQKSDTLTAINQETGENVIIPVNFWYIDNDLLNSSTYLVDKLTELTGGTVTIFQKTNLGLLRISTSVVDSAGKRAINTFIPKNSKVCKAVFEGEKYFGRAFVVDDWYVTAYEPIIINDTVVGAIYVGNKEKDLDELRKILRQLEFGISGYAFVFDNQGKMIIHPRIEGQNWKDSSLFKEFTKNEKGIVNYNFEGKNKTAAYIYNSDFEIYIAAAVVDDEESRGMIGKIVFSSSIIGIIAIMVMLILLYLFTADRIRKFLKKLETSNKKLVSAKEALKQSEERFQKLFDSTGDDIFVTDSTERIIEVNQSTCSNLGFSKEELIGLKMSDIKTPKYAPKVHENREIIYKLGTYTFESEHVSKDGKIIPVEITSRVVNYKNERLILSVARNIGVRKEMERTILTAVIRAEEKERERFAKDMHDGIGPLLSTIKLYVNELQSETMDREERKKFVETSNEIIDEAISSTRTISNNLMPRTIHKYGLIRAMDSFCEKVNKANAVNIDFRYSNIERIDNNLELILFRVITELINNTLKHAKASVININLSRIENKINLNFSDNGIGFNVEEIVDSDHKGMGLKNIVSRIKSINGIYNFDSEEGKGFAIKVEIEL
ncbi:MAG: Cache 3/Cache 2 fusion domain-containing protein [Bacteroidales bacterium]|nr:Cache 3/Cache 2 fusion domain-containing protein [Bacteroidales bacterium]